MSTLRILVVDDMLLHRTVVLRLLQQYGPCEQASDGEEAVKLFTIALDEKKPYNLVVMDIIMPVIDGNEALRMM
ncbi:MAG: response regulator, partial [Lentisphaerota bacterium]